MTETELLQVSLLDLNKSLGISANPVASVVTNWSDCMPIYQLDHSQSVQSLENKLAERVPGIVISGCSYFGVGIPDCIENGENTARKGNFISMNMTRRLEFSNLFKVVIFKSTFINRYIHVVNVFI